MADPGTLRARLRAVRRALDAPTRTAAALRIEHAVVESDTYRSARNLALYVAADGELDPAGIGRAARESGKATWYPDPVDDRLTFRSWDGQAPLTRGRFGIEVPAGGASIAATALDLVLVPLVAFDRTGTRLGMGGGYYDRTFASGPGTGDAPVLVGLAFAEQEVASLDRRSWDVPLDAVVTPTGWMDLKR